ncbi:MAG TPA: SGNH/GDSL hydrolase family protein [Prolixibacteraceae bacterium]|nr:SGNH/GDSL hydrolase family protein [Prolixibacteraceae bacterium]
MNINRRNFLRNATLNTVGLAAIPGILSAAMPFTGKKRKGVLSSLNNRSVIIFQGDSITDAGRERLKQHENTSASFGPGYAFLAASKILEENASKDWSIYNRGISGNKVYQLAERWQRDCFDLHPDVLSILIGVNDFWHALEGRYDGTVEKYEEDFRQLLLLTRKMRPEVQLIIGEPYAVLGCSAVTDKWYPAFDAYRASAKKLAEEYNAIFIPYQSIYDEAQNYAPGKYWTEDGVHPSMAGCSLMAEAWLKAVR